MVESTSLVEADASFAGEEVVANENITGEAVEANDDDESEGLFSAGVAKLQSHYEDKTLVAGDTQTYTLSVGRDRTCTMEWGGNVTERDTTYLDRFLSEGHIVHVGEEKNGGCVEVLVGQTAHNGEIRYVIESREYITEDREEVTDEQPENSAESLSPGFLEENSPDVREDAWFERLTRVETTSSAEFSIPAYTTHEYVSAPAEDFFAQVKNFLSLFPENIPVVTNQAAQEASFADTLAALRVQSEGEIIVGGEKSLVATPTASPYLDVTVISKTIDSKGQPTLTIEFREVSAPLLPMQSKKADWEALPDRSSVSDAVGPHVAFDARAAKTVTHDAVINLDPWVETPVGVVSLPEEKNTFTTLAPVTSSVAKVHQRVFSEHQTVIDQANVPDTIPSVALIAPREYPAASSGNEKGSGKNRSHAAKASGDGARSRLFEQHSRPASPSEAWRSWDTPRSGRGGGFIPSPSVAQPEPHRQSAVPAPQSTMKVIPTNFSEPAYATEAQPLSDVQTAKIPTSETIFSPVAVEQPSFVESSTPAGVPELHHKENPLIRIYHESQNSPLSTESAPTPVFVDPPMPSTPAVFEKEKVDFSPAPLRTPDIPVRTADPSPSWLPREGVSGKEVALEGSAEPIAALEPVSVTQYVARPATQAPGTETVNVQTEAASNEAPDEATEQSARTPLDVHDQASVSPEVQPATARSTSSDRISDIRSPISIEFLPKREDQATTAYPTADDETTKTSRSPQTATIAPSVRSQRRTT